MTVASTPGMSPSSIMIAAHSPAWSSPASNDDSAAGAVGGVVDDAGTDGSDRAGSLVGRAAEDHAAPRSSADCSASRSVHPRTVVSPSWSVCFGRPNRRDDPAPSSTPTTSWSPMLHENTAITVSEPRHARASTHDRALTLRTRVMAPLLVSVSGPLVTGSKTAAPGGAEGEERYALRAHGPHGARGRWTDGRRRL